MAKIKVKRVTVTKKKAKTRIKPKVKKVRKKKQRIHIYIHEDAIAGVDQKAEELGLDRSPCIQLLIRIGLNNLQSDKPKKIKHG